MLVPPPFSYSPEVPEDLLHHARTDPVTFLASDWLAGTTDIVRVHRAGATATIVVNRDEDSVFFEAWCGDSFSEPCYTLDAALGCAHDLLIHMTTNPNPKNSSTAPRRGGS